MYGTQGARKPLAYLYDLAMYGTSGVDTHSEVVASLA